MWHFTIKIVTEMTVVTVVTEVTVVTVGTVVIEVTKTNFFTIQIWHQKICWDEKKLCDKEKKNYELNLVEQN